jgi:hypothetical protein
VLRLPGPPPLALPEWLAPFPQAKEVSKKASPTEATSSYTTPAPEADVVSHYERQLGAAGIPFQTERSGMVAEIVGSTKEHSATIRVREDNSGASVEVSYGPRHDPPPDSLKNGRASETVPGVAGTWTFTCVANRFRGTIVLRQAGSEVTGIWHTAFGKVEPDDQLAARIDGHIMYLTRAIANSNLEQKYVLTIYPDGNRIDGYGEGFGLNHSDLIMQRVPAAPVRSRE